MGATFNLTGFLLVMAGWVLSLCLHEFAHAVVAYFGGDTSVRDKGYLSFNPVRYTDPINSFVWPLVFLVLGGIGLPGGAVYVNRAALRGRGWDCAVSLAGPLANILLLVVLLVPFWLGLVDLDPDHTTIMWAAYAFLCQLQVMAFLFNILPVPPLDGFGAISAFWEPLARARAYALGQFTFVLLLMVLMSDNAVSAGFWGAIQQVSLDVGIPRDLARAGMRMVVLF
jgi:Zn-dependent protease